MSTRGYGAKMLGRQQEIDFRKSIKVNQGANPATVARKEIYDLILARVFSGKSKQEIWEEISSIEEYRKAYPTSILFENATKNTINSLSEKYLKDKIQNKQNKEK